MNLFFPQKGTFYFLKNLRIIYLDNSPLKNFRLNNTYIFFLNVYLPKSSSYLVMSSSPKYLPICVSIISTSSSPTFSKRCNTPFGI